MMYGLLEVDVTRAREFLQDHKAKTRNRCRSPPSSSPARLCDYQCVHIKRLHKFPFQRDLIGTPHWLLNRNVVTIFCNAIVTWPTYTNNT